MPIAASTVVRADDDDAADDATNTTVGEADPVPRRFSPLLPPRRTRPGKRNRRKLDSNHRFLPLPHVSSQPAYGLTLGGSLNYSYRRADEEFNRIYLLAWTRISTRLVQDHILAGRLRDVMGRGEVFQFGFHISIDPVYPYFGVNNHDDLSGTELLGSYNWVSMDNYIGWFTFEHPLWRLHRANRALGVLRHYSGIFYAVDVIHGAEDSRIRRENPEYEGVIRRGVLRGGISWDSRDNDWSPREGSLADLTFDVAGKATGSSSGWGRLHLSVRHYWRLFGRDSGVVLAHRFSFDTLVGRPPLMALGEFGGLQPLDGYGGAFIGRGHELRRFIGNHKATTGVELRYVPIEFMLGRAHVAVGMEFFAEVGTVAQQLSGLLKRGYFTGGPGLLIVWDRFVVLRLDYAFSREGEAFYLQSEHAF